MGITDSKENFSEEKTKDLFDKIVDFVKEKNIDINHINDLSDDDKNELIQKFNDVFEYLASYLLDDKLKDEINDGFTEEFNDTISEQELIEVKNKKYFIKKQESIQSLINDTQEFVEFIFKFEYVYKHKELIFDFDNELSNKELKNNLNYIFVYLKKKNDDINDLNKSMKDLNDSLSKVSPVLKNIVRRSEINNEIKDLNNLYLTKKEEFNKKVNYLKNIKNSQILVTKDQIIEEPVELFNEMNIIHDKINLLCKELDKIVIESFDQCNDDQKNLIEKLRSGEITQEEFDEKAYQKPLDESDDLKYQDEIRRIIEIYNNSSKTNEDKNEILIKMNNFIDLY